jgi:putative sugar O-methyltransferase
MAKAPATTRQLSCSAAVDITYEKVARVRTPEDLNFRPRPGFAFRGRHLFAADTILLILAFAFVLLAAGDGNRARPALALLPLGRAVGLLLSGVYQRSRPLSNRGELLRMALTVAVATLAADLLLTLLDQPVSPLFAAADFVAALAILILLRLLLAAAGAQRAGRLADISAADEVAPPDLAAMNTALAEASDLYRPSVFWRSLNTQHATLLSAEDGFSQFKRTLNTSYFQFGFAAFARSLPILAASWVRRPDAAVFTARVVDRDGLRARAFAIMVALYANALRHRLYGELLDRVIEPNVGRPIVIRYGARTISEDLCHSVEEFGSIMSGLADASRLRHVVEIGAGYGRLAYVFAHARPDVRYHIVDIPPALYVSQRYLTSVLPEAPAFRFRPFDRYDEVASEMGRARLIFLEPQQLELLPDGYADLVLTISTLHEMRPDQVTNYIDVVDRVCSGAFYSKQWRAFYNDLDAVAWSDGAFQLPAGWRLVFKQRPLAPRAFVESLYRRSNTGMVVSRPNS